MRTNQTQAVCSTVNRPQSEITRQGHRLFHKAELSEESVRFPCETADGGGEIDGTGVSQPVESGVAEGRQVHWGVSPKNRAAVLIERRVAHVMQTVLDGTPVIANQRQKLVCRGSRARQRGHIVGRLGLALTVLDSLADDATDLLYAGPVQVLFQRGRGGERPRLQATVAFVHRSRRLLFSSPLSLSVGGKRPPGRR